MYGKYYVTPQKFVEYVEGALRESYYPDNHWNQKYHPEDIASNLEAVILAVRGYLGRAIMDESITAKEAKNRIHGSANIEGTPE
jgi:hypothetical protein